MPLRTDATPYAISHETLQKFGFCRYGLWNHPLPQTDQPILLNSQHLPHFSHPIPLIHTLGPLHSLASRPPYNPLLGTDLLFHLTLRQRRYHITALQPLQPDLISRPRKIHKTVSRMTCLRTRR